MKLDKLCNKQDEYMTPRYAIKPLLKYLDGFKTIWCPFDTSESRYVELKSFTLIYQRVLTSLRLVHLTVIALLATHPIA